MIGKTLVLITRPEKSKANSACKVKVQNVEKTLKNVGRPKGKIWLKYPKMPTSDALLAEKDLARKVWRLQICEQGLQIK